MVDVSITAASLVPASDAEFEEGIAGATITAGQVVYKDPNDSNKLKLADSNSAVNSVRHGAGIAVHGAAAGQPLKYQVAGSLTLGGTLVRGTTYVLSETPGGIQPTADLTSGEYVTVLGTATSTTVLKMSLNRTGVAV